ncbi:MAG: IS21-like element helper ATPase IstB [Chloroflexi bacterium]|nr:IS21-like element helper ATPase IstB [Chloroflexota bacterium]
MEDMAQLRPKLIRLKLSGIMETLDERTKQAVTEKWAPSHFLLMLLTDEVERRNQTQLARNLSKSELEPGKTLETFDFGFNPKIPEAAIRELATCLFIKKHENIFLLGPSGVGKSHLAQGLGHCACRKGHEVLFRRTVELVQWLSAGQGDGSYDRRLTFASRMELLILDDFGLETLTAEQQAGLYEIICRRYEQASTIITSNRDFGEWQSIFSNPLMGSAAMDRLVHRAASIVIEGRSYRLESFTKRNQILTSEEGIE